jgi:hypothetical protein
MMHDSSLLPPYSARHGVVEGEVSVASLLPELVGKIGKIRIEVPGQQLRELQVHFWRVERSGQEFIILFSLVSDAEVPSTDYRALRIADGVGRAFRLDNGYVISAGNVALLLSHKARLGKVS